MTLNFKFTAPVNRGDIRGRLKGSQPLFFLRSNLPNSVHLKIRIAAEKLIHLMEQQCHHLGNILTCMLATEASG